MSLPFHSHIFFLLEFGLGSCLTHISGIKFPFFFCLNFQRCVVPLEALLSMKLFIELSVFGFAVTVLAASLSQKWCEPVGLETLDG